MKRKMSDREMLWSFMQNGLEDFFEIVRVDRSDKSIDVWLDVRREKSVEDKYNPDIVGYGYTSDCMIQDHLMRGVPMFLHLRKCRWLDKKTGVTFSYDIDYCEEKGTRLSAELVSFFNQKVETESLPIKTIARLYGGNGKTFADLYKNKLSGFRQWARVKLTLQHKVPYVCFPENCGRDLGLDETSLSKGKVVTFITNKKHDRMKGSLVAVIFSIKMRDIVEVLESSIPQKTRDSVREVTTDLSSAIMAAAHESFRYATITLDRFHLQMLVNEAGDNLRLKAKNKIRDYENKEQDLCKELDHPFIPSVLSNGETPLQALSRARYAFVTDESKWSFDQKMRIDQLSGYFPELYTGLQTISEFREIFNLKVSLEEAIPKIKAWCEKVYESTYKVFKTVAKTIKITYTLSLTTSETEPQMHSQNHSMQK